MVTGGLMAAVGGAAGIPQKRGGMLGRDRKRRTSGSFRQNPRRRFRARTPDSRFKRPARKRQSSAAPVLARRGERRHFHPLAHEGECSLTKGEGSGAPKGAGNIDTPCGARPCEGRSPRGAP